jgi:hypothetical protein
VNFAGLTIKQFVRVRLYPESQKMQWIFIADSASISGSFHISRLKFYYCHQYSAGGKNGRYV